MSADSDVQRRYRAALDKLVAKLKQDRYVDLMIPRGGPALIQTISSSLRWLMEIVRDRGDRLGAGQINLTGSIPSLIPVDKSCRVRVDAPPFGSVEVNFIA